MTSKRSPTDRPILITFFTALLSFRTYTFLLPLFIRMASLCTVVMRVEVPIGMSSVTD